MEWVGNLFMFLTIDYPRLYIYYLQMYHKQIYQGYLVTFGDLNAPSCIWKDDVHLF